MHVRRAGGRNEHKILHAQSRCYERGMPPPEGTCPSGLLLYAASVRSAGEL